MSPVTRRSFLKRSVAAGIATQFVIAGTRATGQVLGANDTIRVGVAGIKGRGADHIAELGKLEKVQISHLIDTDSRLFEARKKQVLEKFGNEPRCVQDVRVALEDDSLDVLSIATCNHTHSLLTIWACQAGKDVYVEKPCSHNVFEGRKCVEAARKYNRIVQHGTQGRASASWARTAAVIASGVYGKLLVARGWCCKPRWSIGFKQVKEPPKELDFDLWLGPAPEQPYHENLVHYNWHWFWDTGNGDLGNQGVHQMDIARWCIPGATLPKSVLSMGARYVNEPNHGYKDQGETPNQELCVYDYDGTLLVFETRGLVGRHDDWPFRVDNVFYMEEGIIAGGRFTPRGESESQPLAQVDYKHNPGGQFDNFIAACRSRERESQHADILEGHLSSALCHLGNISYRLGEPASWNAITNIFGDNEVVQESLRAVDQNVRDVFPDLSPEYILGPKLTFDAEQERFVDSPDANRLLTRDYRKPFVVPETV